MVSIATRASWGARHKNGDLTLSGLAGEVFLHHTVTAQLPANATVAAEQAQMRNIEQIGQNRFRTGISYNVLIFPSGRAYQGVSWNRRGTHTGGRNSTSRSIAFAGNTDVHAPTGAQIATARAIYHHGRGRWWTNAAPLRSHNAVAATACAGRHAIARLDDIRRPPPAPTPPAPAPAPAGDDDDLEILMSYPLIIAGSDADARTILLSPTRQVNIPSADWNANRSAIIALFGQPQIIGTELANRIRAAVR